MEFSIKVVLTMVVSIAFVLILAFVLNSQFGGAENYLGSMVKF